MDEKKVFLGLGGLAVLMLLVAFLNGGDAEAPAAAVAEAVAEEATEPSPEIDALTARIAELEDRLTAAAEGAAQAADVEALQAQIEAIQADVEGVASASDTLAEQLASIETRATDPVEPEAPAPEPVATTETPEAPKIEGGTGVGQTAVFADGALRVFVSKLDAEAGEARVSIGGAMKTLSVGPGPILAVADTHCQIVVDAVHAGGAELDAICGDDLPPPEGLRVGETAQFDDGKLRVFASMVSDEAARVAVNGELVILAVGEVATADLEDARCRVTLDQVDRGHAKVSAECGAPAQVSDPVGPGATARFGDKARVFVAKVQDDGARIAINGLDLVDAAKGDSFALDAGCDLDVADIDDGKVQFAFACAE